jgi:hypothetical protein
MRLGGSCSLEGSRGLVSGVTDCPEPGAGVVLSISMSVFRVALVSSKPRGHLGISFLPIQWLIHGGAISSSAAIWHYAYAAREWLLSAHLSDFQPDNSRPGLASPLVPHLHHLRNLLWTPLTRPVSRSVTAPFDRLKVYLITTAETAYQQHPGGRKGLAHPFRVAGTAVGNLWLAVTRIYQTGGGVRAFWVGNGLNVTKIFPVRMGWQWLLVEMFPSSCRFTPSLLRSFRP